MAQEHPKEAPKRPTPDETICFWLSRLFASDGHPRPHEGSKVAQEGSNRCSGEPRDGPKSA
eukprot:5494106-Pyramimonas_sp.AAC.1